MPFELRRAESADIPYLMATERGPGFATFVARSESDEHAGFLASPQCAVFIGMRDGAPIGFAILRDIEDRNGNVYLKRIAVAAPDHGEGTALLNALGDWIFAFAASHRFWLDCFEDNLRAQRAYTKIGISVDGRLREAYRLPDGQRKTLVMMAVTRPEWEARREISRRSS